MADPLVRSLLHFPRAELQEWYVSGGQREKDEPTIHYWANLFARVAGFASIEEVGGRASFHHRIIVDTPTKQVVWLYLLIDGEEVKPPGGGKQSSCNLTCELGVLHPPAI